MISDIRNPIPIPTARFDPWIFVKNFVNSAPNPPPRTMKNKIRYMKNLPILNGRSPTILPVCPFMAKVNFLPFHVVFRSHTGKSAYFPPLCIF